MADLIDRQAVLDALEKDWNGMVVDVFNLIRELPSVEAEPVRHGHWVYGEDEDGVDGYRCNKCGFFVTWDYQNRHIHFIDDYLFCPHCNARMDEVTL